MSDKNDELTILLNIIKLSKSETWIKSTLLNINKTFSKYELLKGVTKNGRTYKILKKFEERGFIEKTTEGYKIHKDQIKKYWKTTTNYEITKEFWELI